MKKFLLTVSIILGLLSGCYKAATPDVHERSLIPGECIKSPILKLERFNINDYTSPTAFRFALALDMDLVYEELEYLGHYVSAYRYVPSESVFAQFGENSESVKEAYELDCSRVRVPDSWRLVTLYYDGGLSLTANKDFAGHPAGENIQPELNRVLWYAYDLWDRSRIPEGFPFQYILNDHSICLDVLVGDYSVVDESVTFTLTMPVKIGMYLTWLNDKLTDPGAPYPYREEVLTCTFTINKGLH